eukprot:gene4305-8565_t
MISTKNRLGLRRLYSHQSLNSLLLFAVAIPALLLSGYVFNKCETQSQSSVGWSNDYFNPYWTIIPPLLGAFYKFHPLALNQNFRSDFTFFLTIIWAVRLTHSYFRREGWKVGEREDWRFTNMKEQYPRIWWFMSFAHMTGSNNFNNNKTSNNNISPVSVSVSYYDTMVVDLLVGILCVTGIFIATVADNQLYDFMTMNKELISSQQCPVPILNTGLWRYSRHPNYFGEQLWWWSLGIYGCLSGRVWTLIGPLFNTIIMINVTAMTEERMTTGHNQWRRELFRKYQRETASVWVPWPPCLDEN